MSLAQVQLLTAGHCVHPEHIVLQNWKMGKMRFPAMFAVLEHPREGIVLFDTGYAPYFMEQTRKMPGRIYQWVTPVQIPEDQTAAAHLQALGIRADDVTTIVISHFHADHIAGLKDFPRARFVFAANAWAAVRDRRGMRALLAGFLPGLLPSDFEDRSVPIDLDQLHDLPSDMAPFAQGHDLFGDGEVWAIPLPGHAAGQLGLWIRDGAVHTPLASSARDLFLVADACWTTQSYQQQQYPHAITSLLFSSRKTYIQTIKDLGHLHEARPDLCIVPSHCEQILRDLGAWK